MKRLISTMPPKETIYPSAAATLNLLWRSLKDLTTSPTDSLPWFSNYHGNIGGAGELTYYMGHVNTSNSTTPSTQPSSATS
jgi:hypothetical protein